MQRGGDLSEKNVKSKKQITKNAKNAYRLDNTLLLTTHSLILFHKLHKSLLMYQSSILSIMEHAKVPQTQLGEALIHQIDGGVDVESNGCLLQETIISILSPNR